MPLALASLLAGAVTACGDATVDPDEVGHRAQMTAVAAQRAILFGPQRFARTRGQPRTETVTVTGSDFSSFDPPFVLIVQNGDAQGDHRVSSARVWLDGELILGPDDFSQQVGTLEREVSLGPGSTLEVRNAGAPGSYLDIRIEGTPVAGAEARIGPDGGTVGVDGLAEFTFPAGFFGEEHPVEVSRAEDPRAMRRFTELEGLFRVATKTSYQVRLLIGDVRPDSGAFEAVLVVPEDLTIPSGHRPEFFAQEYEDGGEEILDNFQLISSTWDPDAHTLTTTLPDYVFTDTRRDDGRFEAILMIGTTPGVFGTTASAPVGLQQAAGDPEECEAAFIICPLGTDCAVTSDFGPRRINGKPSVHWGVDLRAANGTDVLAAADGHIERIDPIDDGPDGYGLYIILRHSDGSATLYGHLQEVRVEDGATVSQGDVIALSNDSGSASEGPHLHLDYVPNGEIIFSKERIDPFPCMQDRTVEGSITVRDNGNLADDAFGVFLDGRHLGTTDIGAANSFAINNLIPGDHTLTITGVTVPDDAGTFEVILSDGLTFTDGSVRRSGVIGAGGSATFGIIVPTSSAQATFARDVPPSLLMRPNEVREGGT